MCGPALATTGANGFWVSVPMNSIATTPAPASGATDTAVARAPVPATSGSGTDFSTYLSGTAAAGPSANDDTPPPTASAAAQSTATSAAPSGYLAQEQPANGSPSANPAPSPTQTATPSDAAPTGEPPISDAPTSTSEADTTAAETTAALAAAQAATDLAAQTPAQTADANTQPPSTDDADTSPATPPPETGQKGDTEALDQQAQIAAQVQAAQVQASLAATAAVPTTQAAQTDTAAAAPIIATAPPPPAGKTALPPPTTATDDTTTDDAEDPVATPGSNRAVAQNADKTDTAAAIEAIGATTTGSDGKKGTTSFAEMLAPTVAPAPATPVTQTPSTMQAAGKLAVATAANTDTDATLTSLDAMGLTITAKAQAGLKNFTIQITPPELGRVEVKLTVDAGGTGHATLIVDKPQTLTLLQQDASGLANSLRDAGINLSGGGLNFSLREQNQQSDGHQADTGRSLRVGAVAADEGTAPEAANIVPRPGYGYDFGYTRLDIRV